MGSFSIWHWLIVLLIVALVFGTKRLRSIGSDLGSAVKGFKEGMKDADTPSSSAPVSVEPRRSSVRAARLSRSFPARRTPCPAPCSSTHMS